MVTPFGFANPQLNLQQTVPLLAALQQHNQNATRNAFGDIGSGITGGVNALVQALQRTQDQERQDKQIADARDFAATQAGLVRTSARERFEQGQTAAETRHRQTLTARAGQAQADRAARATEKQRDRTAAGLDSIDRTFDELDKRIATAAHRKATLGETRRKNIAGEALEGKNITRLAEGARIRRESKRDVAQIRLDGVIGKARTAALTTDKSLKATLATQIRREIQSVENRIATNRRFLAAGNALDSAQKKNLVDDIRDDDAWVKAAKKELVGLDASTRRATAETVGEEDPRVAQAIAGLQKKHKEGMSRAALMNLLINTAGVAPPQARAMLDAAGI